jgi:hypothetical protein
MRRWVEQQANCGADEQLQRLRQLQLQQRDLHAQHLQMTARLVARTAICAQRSQQRWAMRRGMVALRKNAEAAYRMDAAHAHTQLTAGVQLAMLQREEIKVIIYCTHTLYPYTVLIPYSYTVLIH